MTKRRNKAAIRRGIRWGGNSAAPAALAADYWLTSTSLPLGTISSWVPELDTLSFGSVVPATDSDFATITGAPSAVTVAGRTVVQLSNSTPGGSVEQALVSPVIAPALIQGNKTLFVVVRDNGGMGGAQYYIADSVNTQPHLRRLNSNTLRYSGDPNVDVSTAPNPVDEFLTFGGRVTGTLHEAYFQSNSIGGSATGTVAEVSNILMGCDRLGNDALDGYIAEVVIFDRSLTDAEISTLVSWANGIRDALNA